MPRRGDYGYDAPYALIAFAALGAAGVARRADSRTGRVIDGGAVPRDDSCGMRIGARRRRA